MTLSRRSLLRAGALGLTGGLAGCSVLTSFETVWTGRVSWPVPSLVVGDGRVFAIDPEPVALSTADGDELWSFRTESGQRHSRAALDGDRLFSATEGGRVHALDRSDGTERWRRTFDRRFECRPVVADGAVHVAGTDGTTYALDATDGTTRWTYTPEVPPDRGEFGVDRVRLTVAGGTVYLVGYDSRLRALDAATGRERWAAEFDSLVWGPVTVVDGTVVAGALEGGVSGLRAADGSTKWHRDRPDAFLQAAVADDTLYLPAGTEGLFALDPADGSERWSRDANPTQPVATGDGFLAFGDTEGRLVAFTTDGRRLLRTKIDGEVVDVAAAGPRLYAGATHGQVVAFERQ